MPHWFGGQDVEDRSRLSVRLVPAGTEIEVFSDDAGTVPVVDLLDADEDPLDVLVVNEYSQVPRFRTASDLLDIVYVKVLDGPVTSISADVNNRVEELEDAFEASGAALFTQGTPSTVWDIEHNLGYDPAGFVILSNDGTQHYPAITYISPGQMVRLTFDDTVAGTARMS